MLDEEDHEVMLQMSSSSINPAGTSTTYQPKCSFISGVMSSQHPALALDRDCAPPELPDTDLDQDVVSLLEHYVNAKLQSGHRHNSDTSSTCTCQRDHCLFRRYLERLRGPERTRRNDLNSSSFLRGCIKRQKRPNSPTLQGEIAGSKAPPAPPQGEEPLHPLPELPPDTPHELVETLRDFIAIGGGRQRVTRLYNKVLSLLPCLPDLMEPSSNDRITLLMILCCQPSTKRDDTQLYLHILVVILALQSGLDSPGNSGSTGSPGLAPQNLMTDLLFQRNYQEASALELAALSNKSIVVKYLALLYASLDRDVNETNRAGHSVLHLLARKGDEAADALETLLTLQSGGKKLLRLDVVNKGGKTPLDVANVCQDSYQDVSFRQVLSLFHQTIQQQVEELMASSVLQNTF